MGVTVESDLLSPVVSYGPGFFGPAGRVYKVWFMAVSCRSLVCMFGIVAWGGGVGLILARLYVL